MIQDCCWRITSGREGLLHPPTILQDPVNPVRNRSWRIAIAIGIGIDFRSSRSVEFFRFPHTPAPIPAQSRSSVSGPHRPSSRCPRRCSTVSIDWRAAIGHAPSGGCPSGHRLSRRPRQRSGSPGGRRPISRVQGPLTFLLLSIPIPIAISIAMPQRVIEPCLDDAIPDYDTDLDLACVND